MVNGWNLLLSLAFSKEEDQKKKGYKSSEQFGLSGDMVDDGSVEDGDAVFDS